MKTIEQILDHVEKMIKKPSTNDWALLTMDLTEVYAKGEQLEDEIENLEYKSDNRKEALIEWVVKFEDEFDNLLDNSGHANDIMVGLVMRKMKELEGLNDNS